MKRTEKKHLWCLGCMNMWTGISHSGWEIQSVLLVGILPSLTISRHVPFSPVIVDGRSHSPNYKHSLHDSIFTTTHADILVTNVGLLSLGFQSQEDTCLWA